MQGTELSRTQLEQFLEPLFQSRHLALGALKARLRLVLPEGQLRDLALELLHLLVVLRALLVAGLGGMYELLM